MVTRKCVTKSVCASIGVVLIATGCVLINVFSGLIHSEVDDQIPLKEGSDAYKRWQKPKSPIYLQVWMFDVVNHEEVLQGEKPVVVQKGPYGYRGTRERYNISYSEDNEFITYRTKRTYYFDPDLSIGPDNDTFHCVNLPLLTIASITRWETETFKEVVNAALKLTGESLFLKLSVRELMWGYEVKLLKAVNDLMKEFHVNFTISDRFGLFANQNASDNGLFKMYSGIKDITKFANIVEWDGAKKLKWWTDEWANAINGSEGIMYPPFINDDKKYLFSSDLCRSIGLNHQDSVNIRGIDMERFVAPVDLLASASRNRYNKGFCTPAGNCLPSGFLNISTCRAGAPVIMSMPHFLGCDEKIVNSITGLSPNKDEFESYVDIEPTTGVTMNVGKKLQINTYVEKIEGFMDTYNFNGTFLPIMWMNESAMISEQEANDFSDKVYGKITLTKAVQYCIIALGTFIVLCVVIVVVKQWMWPATKHVESFVDEDSPLILPNTIFSS